MDAELWQHTFEVFPVRHVERHKRSPSAVHLFHGGLAGAAPVIGKGRGVGLFCAVTGNKGCGVTKRRTQQASGRHDNG
jgi:hypothetical protein